jgi:hypothetical protein
MLSISHVHGDTLEGLRGESACWMGTLQGGDLLRIGAAVPGVQLDQYRVAVTRCWPHPMLPTPSITQQVPATQAVFSCLAVHSVAS